MSKTTVIANVPSTSSPKLIYTIIQRGNGNWECDCPSHFLSEDRRVPCKHIRSLRSLNRLPKGAITSRTVRLTRKGEVVLRRWRKRNNLPEVKE